MDAANAEPREIGRPTKYNETTAELICKHVAEGNTKRDAAILSGISQSTFYQWQKDFPEFSEKVTRAESEATSLFVASLKRAGQGFERKETIKTTKEVLAKRVLFSPDGKKTEEIQEPVTLTETVERYIETEDWKAAESYLKRRRRDDWTERIEVADTLNEKTAETERHRLIQILRRHITDDETLDKIADDIERPPDGDSGGFTP